MASSTYPAGDEKLPGLLVLIEEFVQCLEFSINQSRTLMEKRLQYADDSIRQSIDTLVMQLKDTRRTVKEMKKGELRTLQTWNFGLFQLAASCMVCFEAIWKSAPGYEASEEATERKPNLSFRARRTGLLTLPWVRSYKRQHTSQHAGYRKKKPSEDQLRLRPPVPPWGQRITGLSSMYVCKDDVDHLFAELRGHIAAIKLILGSIELYETW
jgi:hypothetical protein